MATVCPFKGITYNKNINPDLVVSAPYDVISPEEREEYKSRHESNFVNLILGDEFASDTEENNRFTRAGKYIREWLDKGVLVQSEKPVLYMYQQKFVKNGRTNIINGFIGAVKICEYSENIILPHENTLSRPKGALEKTIECTGCNLDCVYGLYADPEQELGAVIESCLIRTPDIAAHDIDGNEHNVWVIADDGQINTITSFMSDKQIAIADGHHRYETALKHRNTLRDEGKGTEASEYVMMTIVNVFEKDLTVLPTHRVIFGLDDVRAESLVNELEKGFEVKKTDEGCLTEAMAGIHLGLVAPDAAYVLVKKAGTAPKVEASKYTKELELTLLHKCILEDILSIDKNKLAQQTNVIYTRSYEEACSLVHSGKAQFAFICNDIPVKAILDIASVGEKMPQKATYFYPKLLSGMVIRSLK